MAGTIVIDTLQDGSGNSTSATNAIQGSAKAWVNFNGVTTATVRASYNVSSVTRNSLANYTINMTNALADANYAVAASAQFTLNGICWCAIHQQGTTSTPPTTTAFSIYITNGGGANDSAYITCAAFR